MTIAEVTRQVYEQAAVGQMLGANIAYVTRKSALNQAEIWNTLTDHSLPPGLRVGVGARVDGRYPLVWEATS